MAFTADLLEYYPKVQFQLELVLQLGRQTYLMHPGSVFSRE